jgi:hypothetical protein
MKFKIIGTVLVLAIFAIAYVVSKAIENNQNQDQTQVEYQQ